MMEFDRTVGVLFRDAITKVDRNIHVCRNTGNSFQLLRENLFHIIDKMGEASARAQGLTGSITTGRRLEMSDHHLYIMRDTETNNRVIGFLKVGRKRLFVYDRHGQQWEMNPLCILDFYVHESRQRMGCGRRLFDYMVKSEGVSPKHFAIDRPSHKFSSFLAKHYGLRTEIPQVNNFVIFEGFFTNHPESDFINKGRRGNAKPADYDGNNKMEPQWAVHKYSKNQHYQPNSSRPPSVYRGNQAHAGMHSRSSPHIQQDEQNGLRDLNINPRSAHNLGGGQPSPNGGYSDTELRSVSAGSSTHRGMGLQNTMYSRHQATSTGDETAYNQAKSMLSPSPPYNNAKQSSSTYNVVQQPPSGPKNKDVEKAKTPPLLQRDGPPRDYLASFNMHQDYQGRGGHLKVPADPRVGIQQPANTSNASGSNTTTTGITSGDRNNSTQIIGALNQEARATQYQDYQFTFERLATRLPAINNKQTSSSPLNSNRSAFGYGYGYYTRPAVYSNGDNTWTVMGVLRNQNHLSARNYGHSRLW